MIRQLVNRLSLGGAMIAASLGATMMPAAADNERFVLLSHGPDSDSWWNTIKNAIKEAGRDLKVTVEYRNPPNGDLADMARLVEQAAASNPAGIITTIADFDVLKGPIQAAVKKGIPVVTINSGTPQQSAELGALMHIGQPEYDAGLAAGKRAKAAGVTSFLCVNHFITNPVSVDRCKGFADGLGLQLGSQMIDSGLDPTGIENKVTANLRANPNTGGVLTLGPDGAVATMRALDKLRLAGKIYFATFDLSPEITAAIKSGTITFAIDQQPYLQGYLPVAVLTLYHRYGVIPGNNINSGPGFVTKDNVDKVAKLAGEYR